MKSLTPKELGTLLKNQRRITNRSYKRLQFEFEHPRLALVFQWVRSHIVFFPRLGSFDMYWHLFPLYTIHIYAWGIRTHIHDGWLRRWRMRRIARQLKKEYAQENGRAP